MPAYLYFYQPMTHFQLFCLVLSGVFAGIGQFAVTIAYSYAPAKEISIFDYSNIIFTTILSIFLFGDYPDAYSFIGYFIIFAAAFWMFLYNRHLDRVTPITEDPNEELAKVKAKHRADEILNGPKKKS